MEKEWCVYRIKNPDGTWSSGGTWSGKTIWTSRGPATVILKRSPAGSVMLEYRLDAPVEVARVEADKVIKKLV